MVWVRDRVRFIAIVRARLSVRVMAFRVKI
jgi:hypothetical protein